jgi:hypothetical protein
MDATRQVSFDPPSEGHGSNDADTTIPLDRDEAPEDERSSFTDGLAGAGMILMVLGFFAIWGVGFITFVRWLWH